jgi:hypothetical protein
VFTARYGLIPYMKHVTFRLLKVNLHNLHNKDYYKPLPLFLTRSKTITYCWNLWLNWNGSRDIVPLPKIALSRRHQNWNNNWMKGHDSTQVHATDIQSGNDMHSTSLQTNKISHCAILDTTSNFQPSSSYYHDGYRSCCSFSNCCH